MLEFSFWLLLLLAVYSYFIYPLVLAVMTSLKLPSATARAQALTLRLTLIITAFNERARIRDKLENTLAIDYPALEIIVASDCSTDETDQIVGEYIDRGVKLVRAPERLGKENTQLCAIRESNGEIIVFSDVATEIPTDALRKLAEYFSDPQVGAVSSEDRFTSQDGGVAGEGAYVRYEMWLRRMESRLAGLVGLSGSFFAARKAVCQEWDIHSPSDFNTALNCARLDYRAITAPDVLGYYKDLKDPQKEYQRKVRTVLRGMTAIARHHEVLSPSRYHRFAFQVWSHKMMRWLVPLFLALLLLVSFCIAGRSVFYALMLIAQLGFYGVAFAAHRNEEVRKNAIARIIYFFVQVNVAIADAAYRYFSGKRMTTWQPSAR